MYLQVDRGGHLSWLLSFFINLTHSRVIWKEGTSAEKIPLLDRFMGKPMETSSRLMIDILRPVY